MTTHKQPTGHVQGIRLIERRGPSGQKGSEYDWPQSPLLELWALRVQLDAACRKGEARQGWIPCRVVRRVLGVPA